MVGIISICELRSLQHPNVASEPKKRSKYDMAESMVSLLKAYGEEEVILPGWLLLRTRCIPFTDYLSKVEN